MVYGTAMQSTSSFLWPVQKSLEIHAEITLHVLEANRDMDDVDNTRGKAFLWMQKKENKK